jgi:hypothetical protein
MKTPKKHMIIARLLISLLVIPSLWQLEHTFNNQHGIVYHQEIPQLTHVSDASCAIFHKQLIFNATIPVPEFQILLSILESKINISFPDKVILATTYDFHLRAPPVVV